MKALLNDIAGQDCSGGSLQSWWAAGTAQPGRSATRLGHAVQAEGCAVSKAMIDDIAAQEAACKASLQRAQDKMQHLNPDAQIGKHQAALDDLQRRAFTLRQVCPRKSKWKWGRSENF